MRLINADALIGDLHNCTFLDGDDRSIVYNVIQKQPTVCGWVSVKDRMPDKSGPYLVMLGNMFVEHLTKKVYYWDAKIGYWRGVEAHSMIIGITHWMPLPEPPEEVKA